MADGGSNLDRIEEMPKASTKLAAGLGVLAITSCAALFLAWVNLADEDFLRPLLLISSGSVVLMAIHALYRLAAARRLGRHDDRPVGCMERASLLITLTILLVVIVGGLWAMLISVLGSG